MISAFSASRHDQECNACIAESPRESMILRKSGENFSRWARWGPKSNALDRSCYRTRYTVWIVSNVVLKSHHMKHFSLIWYWFIQFDLYSHIFIRIRVRIHVESAQTRIVFNCNFESVCRITLNWNNTVLVSCDCIQMVFNYVSFFLVKTNGTSYCWFHENLVRLCVCPSSVWRSMGPRALILQNLISVHM
jgi:hypothetical protein